MRPSRKFNAPKGDDAACDDELREKQQMRAQRLQALAEETFDEDAFAKRKSDFASKLLDDEYVLLIFFFFCLIFLFELALNQHKNSLCYKILNIDQSNRKSRTNKSNSKKKKLNVWDNKNVKKPNKHVKKLVKTSWRKICLFL